MKIKDLQLENQIIQEIYVVQFQYPGLPVGEPTESGEPRFSTMEIQKIRRTNQSSRTMVLHCGDPKNKVLNSHIKIKDLQLKNQIIQGIMVLLYGDPGFKALKI